MGRMKKPKQPKLPKPAIKEKVTKEVKKKLKLDKKKQKAREKKINTMLGAVAIVLCLITSILDMIASKGKKS